jgi:CheY-like chemotaxis protein
MGAGQAVLVVDSFEDGATTLALVLGLYGHAVRVAADAGAALAAAAAARPEVIIVDPWRVAADPAGLAGRLAAGAGGCPLLVALTGYVRPGDRGRVPGFDHTLLKPCDPEALARLIAGRVRPAPPAGSTPPAGAQDLVPADGGFGTAGAL